MNGDNSQQSKDNWVQKTVRNLEGMNRARHVSADQGNDKPISYSFTSKRNSAPVVYSRQSTLPRSGIREKQTATLRPLSTPKSRSISPVSVNSSQISVKTTKTETIKPDPPVRKSSLASPNRLVSSRLLQFQPNHSETEKHPKPCSSTRSISLDSSSQSVNGTLSVKKVPSPTPHVSSGSNVNAKSNSLKRMMSDGRPPRSSSKTTDSSFTKSSLSKTSKLASPSHQVRKPSVKPKPSVSVASTSKTSSDVRASSRPSSAQTTEGKSPLHSSIRQPNTSRTSKGRPPVSKSPHSSSIQTDTTTTAATAKAKVVKDDEKPARSKEDYKGKVDSQIKKSSNGRKSPISKSYSSKLSSPKISRKQLSSTKSATTTKSAIKAPSRASAVPVPKKAGPPPILSPKPVLNEAISKAGCKAGSASTVLTGEQKVADSSSENEALINNKPNQETLTCIEAPTVTDTTMEAKENVTEANAVVKSTDDLSFDNNDEDLYDDVIRVPSTTSIVSSKSNSDIGDDTAHKVATETSTTKDDEDNSLSNNDVAAVKGDAVSDDAVVKIPTISTQPNEENQDASLGPLVQHNTTDNLLTVNQTKEGHSIVCNDGEIYDDVVAQCFKQTLSEELKSSPAKIEGFNKARDDASPPGKTLSPHQETKPEAFYDDIIYPERIHQNDKGSVKRVSYDDFQVAELCVSPRQSRVASFQRAGDKNFGYRDSGLGIEAYYDKIDHSDDVVTEPAFYDQIGEDREQLETVSSAEDILQSESSTENVLAIKDLEPPVLPPRPEDMIQEVRSNLTGTLLEVSSKVEATTVESGFEDHCFDNYCNEESKDTATTKIPSKVKPDPLVFAESYDKSPPPLPPRRPCSTQLDADDMPLRSPGYLSRRAGSGSPQLPLSGQRKVSAPQLLSSPKDFVSSSSSLTPSHSAVSIISGRSEDRNATDGGSDVSSLVDVPGEYGTNEHKKEKSKFSLGFFTRKKSDKRKKTEDHENPRQRASTIGQTDIHRKKSSRLAIKKKGSLPPEAQLIAPEAEYSFPDPIHFTDDKEYDDCTVIKNNWKSPPPDSNCGNSFSTDATPTVVTSNNVPELLESPLNKNKEILKSTESLGSFAQNFENSSGWFDDLYDMVANSSTYISEISEVKLTVTAETNEDIYDAVAADLPDEGKLVVTDSPNLNRRVSSSSGSFDSLEEDEDDHLSPLTSDLSNTLKGHSLPQRPVKIKVASPTRPRSYSNANQTVEILQSMELSGSFRPAENIKEGVMETALVYADAVWDYDPTEEGDLKFHANDVIEVMDMTNDDWWLGYINDSSGWFPASYVRIRVGQEEVENADENQETGEPQLQRVESGDGPVTPSRSFRKTVRRASSDRILDKKLSRSEYRAKIVEEIVETEQTYVKYLGDVVEGYMERCITSPHLFTPDRIEVIFANIKDLLNFQKKFLSKLETCVTPADLSQSQIGAIFTDHQTEFSIYSEYCNNHPYAVNEMNEVQEDPQYRLFFESCRLLRNLGDLPLEAFLLKPVQKICKYPLQLSELLKYTDTNHPDYVFVKDAVEAMKDVASLINSRKRRIENLYKLALWQKAIENWKGDHVVERSSEELFSGDLQKISKGHSQERHFTLFDHQLIYCKREAIGHKLQYRGRIIMDNCKIIDLADGEEIYSGSPVKNAWKINNETKNKWYVLYSKDPTIKEAWMDAFNRERQRVQDDAISKFNIPSRLRKMAIAQADKSTKKEIRTKLLHDSREQYGLKQQRSSSVFQGSPSAPKKKASKKKKTKRLPS